MTRALLRLFLTSDALTGVDMTLSASLGLSQTIVFLETPCVFLGVGFLQAPQVDVLNLGSPQGVQGNRQTWTNVLRLPQDFNAKTGHPLRSLIFKGEVPPPLQAKVAWNICPGALSCFAGRKARRRRWHPGSGCRPESDPRSRQECSRRAPPPPRALGRSSANGQPTVDR